MALYEVLIIGSPEANEVSALTKQLVEVAKVLALEVPEDLSILTTADLPNLKSKGRDSGLVLRG